MPYFRESEGWPSIPSRDLRRPDTSLFAVAKPAD